MCHSESLPSDVHGMRLVQVLNELKLQTEFTKITVITSNSSFLAKTYIIKKSRQCNIGPRGRVSWNMYMHILLLHMYICSITIQVKIHY